MFKKSKNENGLSPLSQIQDFYRFMVEQSLEVLEYDHEGLHVRMERRKSAQVPVPVPVYSPGAANTSTNGAREDNVARPVLTTATPSLPPNASTIKAPMMGIFYRASTPSSPPFAKNGDPIKKGQVLCLIEAMKVFNEVKADFDCMIVQDLVENGKPVKVDQDLFIVERK